MKVKSLSRVQHLVTPWTAAHQAPLSKFSQIDTLTWAVQYGSHYLPILIWIHEIWLVQIDMIVSIKYTSDFNYFVWTIKNVLYLVAQSCLTLCNSMDCSPPAFSVHGDSPGKTTGVGCHFFLQGIFPTQDWTQVSHIADEFLTIWATRMYIYLII